MMRFIFITNSAELAAYATARGVDRIMVDLELLGKVERQGHLSTVISRHAFEDIARVRAAIPDNELIVRLNPVYENSASEIDRAVALGADVLMLPMFRSAQEVERFCKLVNKRARVCLLLETAAGAAELETILTIDGVDEVHIGLNDLHLDLGQSFMFEPLYNGTVEELATIVRSAGLPLGIGGLARAGEGLLPAEMIVAEHVRLKSTGAILSRTFHRNGATVADIEREMDFGEEVRKLQLAYQSYRETLPQEFLAIRREATSRIAAIIRSKAASS